MVRQGKFLNNLFDFADVVRYTADVVPLRGESDDFDTDIHRVGIF
jgi:hypothetical protein